MSLFTVLLLILTVGNAEAGASRISSSCQSYEELFETQLSYGGACQSDAKNAAGTNASNTARRINEANEKREFCTAPAAIPESCVAESILQNAANEPAPTYACPQDDAGVIRGKRIPRPCGGKNIARYFANETNRALACLNSDGDKLTPKEVFSIINHESHFTPNVASGGGIGMMQLTSSAVNAFYSPEVSPLWDKLKGHSECRDFVKNDEYLGDNGGNKVLRSGTGKRGHVLQCQFLNFDTNPARSLIIGLSLYKTYKKTITKRIEKDGVDLRGADDLLARLTEVAYNRGLGRAMRAYRHQKGVFRKDKTKLKLASMRAFDFDVRLDDLKTEIKRRYQVFLPASAANEIDGEVRGPALPPFESQVLDAIFFGLESKYFDQSGANDAGDKFLKRDQIISFLKEVESYYRKKKEDDVSTLVQNILKVMQSKNIDESDFLYADKIVRDMNDVERTGRCRFSDKY